MRRIAALALMVVSLLAAACSNSEAETVGVPAPAATMDSTTTSTTAPDDLVSDGPPIEALEELWGSTLAVFASVPEERPDRLVELGDRVPGNVEELAPVYFPLALTIESNANFVPISDDEVAIADCAFTSQPTLLGSATAGFEATGQWDAAAEQWAVTDLEYVKECVPRELAEAALIAVEQYDDGMDEAWPALDDEHPVLTDGMTEEYRAQVVENMESRRERGWIGVIDIERESYEVTGMLRQDGMPTVLISRCTHYGDGNGTFTEGDDGELTRVEEIEPIEAARVGMRMVLYEDGTWRFDGFGTVEKVDCLDAPTDSAASQL